MNDEQVASLTVKGFVSEIQRLAQSEQDPDRVQILEELAMYVEGIMPPQAFG